MLTFKANYLSSAVIQRNNVYKPCDKNVSFVEIFPSNYFDKVSLNQAAVNWDKKGEDSFAYSICKALNTYKENDLQRYDNRFFAITTQKSNFDNLDSKKILAMTQVRNFDDESKFVEYLQVDPMNSKRAKMPEFRYIGKAMLDSLKQLFNNQNIILDSVKNAVKFYLKNGFVKVSDRSYEEFRMIWRFVSKSLH